METAPDQEPSPERKLQERNLLKNPGATIRAMAYIEGPAWMHTQREAEERISEEHITEPQAILDVAAYTVIGALDRLRNMEPDELAEELHGVYTIHGNGSVDRYLVLSDGTVKFSRFHAASREHLQKAEELGFEIE